MHDNNPHKDLPPPVSPDRLLAIETGDRVRRVISDAIFMDLTVTEVTYNRIRCNDWEFDRLNGEEIEIDAVTKQEITSGYSYIVPL